MAMASGRMRRPVRLRPEYVVLAVAAAAWGFLIWPALTGGAHAHPDARATVAVPALLGGWLAMVLAMMLPPALPLARTLAALGDRRLPALGLAAVVGVWLAVGAMLVAVSVAGSRLLAGLELGPRAGALATGAALVLAGGYQFSPLKAACLTACRTPRWFVLRYWHGRRPLVETLRLGAAYGAACVGCCGALMGVCVVAGAAALPSMIVLSALMAVERLTRRGRRAARTAGGLLVAAGVATALGVLPDPLALLLLGTH